MKRALRSLAARPGFTATAVATLALGIAALWVISPIDLIPEFLPVIGPLDDVVVVAASGQLIGYVGDSGDAQGCHLHFEMWSAPGWYDGGAPVDPLPSLQSWDRHS